MCDMMRMAVAKSFNNLQKHFPCIGFSKIANLIQSIKQLSSATETKLINDLLSN